MDSVSGDALRGQVEDGDDWRNVTDAKKRKQIQDRLAQRARRKRLREAKQNGSQRNSLDAIEHQNARHGNRQSDASDASPEFVSFDSSGLISFPGSCITLASPSQNMLLFSSVSQAPSMSYELPYSPPTVFSALFTNGEILGILSCGDLPKISPPASSDVPLTLHPTLAQLTTPHSTGVDRFPFPRMRDNMILMNAFYDGDEFQRDLFTMPSFTVTPGIPPWDPRGWKMEKYFAEKWGFLFF
ncbi:Aryl-alcohol dehydrogenase protein [Rutstroemia sp. NJR-2017a BBW]|nr:Aryl-alcohol dehydrogenase protein [Rutstroemia sp. NJR-2017a BBW]